MKKTNTWHPRYVAPVIALSATTAFAHQPVMDMAPRWQDGYGVQVRYTTRDAEKLRDGKDHAQNLLGRSKRVEQVWLEGVYTFHRALRVTAKLPYVDQYREVEAGGTLRREHGEGWGDGIVAVPLKKYWNRGASTANLGFTPQIRVPTGSTRDDYAIGDGSWDAGFGVSFSTETPKAYMLTELFYWFEGTGKRGIERGNLAGLDVNLGLHPVHSNKSNSGLFVMLDISARNEERGRDQAGVTGGATITIGPVVVLYRQNLMWRGEVHIPVYEDVEEIQLEKGILYQAGIGMTF